MGRRLPRHTVRKSTGERRLPDKTNNARDSSEDGSEEVRAPRQEARRGAADLFVAVFLSAEGAGARTATSQRQNERPEQQLPDNRGGPHLEQQLEMTKKGGRGRPLGSRKITCTKTPLPQGSVGCPAIVLQVPDKKRTNRNARDLASCVKSDAKDRGLKLSGHNLLTVQKIQSLWTSMPKPETTEDVIVSKRQRRGQNRLCQKIQSLWASIPKPETTEDVIVSKRQRRGQNRLRHFLCVCSRNVNLAVCHCALLPPRNFTTHYLNSG
jgi:hypothetical protein